jgi:hypothetical protein
VVCAGRIGGLVSGSAVGDRLPGMRARARADVLLVGAALGLAGCGVKPPASRFPTADDALARMKATYACVNGVQGAAKIDVFAPQGRVRGDLYLFAVNPDRVRFEIISPFGLSLYTLTSDGRRFALADAKDKQFLYGPAKTCNLARLTRVPVPGHALVSLLRGEAPVLLHERGGASIDWDRGGFYRVLVRGTHDGLEEVHLEVRPDDRERPWSEQRLRVTNVVVEQQGIPLYEADLGRHEPAHTAPPRVDEDGIEPPVPPSGPACDAELPRSIRVRVPNTEQDVLIQYKDAKWNPPLVSGTFTQPEPGGVRREYVDCD